MALLLAAPLLYKSFIGRQHHNLSDQKLLDSLVAKIDPGSISPDGKISSDSYTSAGKKVLFKFDPNTVSYDDMRQLGMSDLIARRIIKFRNKGGRFVTKKDLQKIYDLPELLFYQLEVYIVLPELTTRNASNFLNNESPVNYSNETFDINANPDRDKVIGANKPFDFDPNTVSYDEMRQLGMSSLIAQRIIKYQDKGGRFSAKKDLQKIYDFPETLYAQLEKYITLPGTQYKKIERFNINIADTVQLQRIYGIGSVLSNRVIKFRDELGGFVSLDQLREVYYGRDSIAALKELLKYAYIADDFIPKKILINSADFDELNRHPYISYKLARTVVAYRNQHGAFESVKAVKKIKVLSEVQFEKLAPYLSADPR